MEKEYKKQYSSREQTIEAIWSILREHSSQEHPLTVSEICDILKRTEDPPPCKRTVDNRLQEMKTYGGAGVYELYCVAQKRDRYGRIRTYPYDELESGDKNNIPRLYYLEGPLTRGEWRFLSDFVQDQPCIARTQTRALLDVLDLLIQPKPSRAPDRQDLKPARSAMLDLVERIDRAIRERKKLLVTVGDYDLEKRGGRLVPVLRPREEIEFAPCTLVWSGGHYWLAGRGQKPAALRLDRLLRVEQLDESFTPSEVLDRADPALTAAGERAVVRLRCTHALLGDVAELLGKKAQYSALREDGTFEVIAPADLERVKTLALRRPDGMEVLEPESLRQDILDTLRQGMARYGL